MRDKPVSVTPLQVWLHFKTTIASLCCLCVNQLGMANILKQGSIASHLENCSFCFPQMYLKNMEGGKSDIKDVPVQVGLEQTPMKKSFINCTKIVQDLFLDWAYQLILKIFGFGEKLILSLTAAVPGGLVRFLFQ